MICQSCGGVLGRDCFNPEECQWISDRMAAEYAAQQFEQYAAQAYEAHVGKLHQQYIEEMAAGEAGFDPIALGM